MSDSDIELKPDTLDIAGREYSYFGNIDDSFNAYEDALYYLTHLRTLVIQGPDSQSFLQGQLTIDVTKATDGSIGLYCNKEGRIISLFFILKEDNQFMLVMPKDIIDICQKKLKRFALFSKVTLSQSDDHIFMLKKGSHMTPLLVKADKVKGLCQSVENDHPLLGSLAWHYHLITQLTPSIYPQTLEKWLPHKLGLHKLNALDFDKGCYLGQEIIARMHFKAKLKHTVICFKTSKIKTLEESLKIEDKVVGEVIDYSPCKDNQTIILASVLKSVEAEIKANPECLD